MRRGLRGAAPACCRARVRLSCRTDRKSTRLNSSHLVISYAVFCLKKKNLPAITTVTRLLARRITVAQRFQAAEGAILSEADSRRPIVRPMGVSRLYPSTVSDHATL